MMQTKTKLIQQKKHNKFNNLFASFCNTSYRLSSPEWISWINSKLMKTHWMLIPRHMNSPVWMRPTWCCFNMDTSFSLCSNTFLMPKKMCQFVSKSKTSWHKDAQISISRMTINPLESSFPRQDTRSKVLEPSWRRLATPQLRDSKLPASSAHLGCLEIRPRGWMRYCNISTYNKSLNLASKDEKHSDLHLPRAVMHAFFGGEMIQLSQSVVDC